MKTLLLLLLTSLHCLGQGGIWSTNDSGHNWNFEFYDSLNNSQHGETVEPGATWYVPLRSEDAAFTVIGGPSWLNMQQVDCGNDWSLWLDGGQFQFAPVPEPSVFALTAVAIALYLRHVRRIR